MALLKRALLLYICLEASGETLTAPTTTTVSHPWLKVNVSLVAVTLALNPEGLRTVLDSPAAVSFQVFHCYICSERLRAVSMTLR